MSGIWRSDVFYWHLSSLKVKASGRVGWRVAGAVPADPSYPALKIYFLPAMFRRSKDTTCNSKANSLIWPRNRPRLRFIPVIVTFMFIPPVYEVYRGYIYLEAKESIQVMQI